MSAIGSAYSTQEVSELLEWPAARIYNFVRSGLVHPQKNSRGEFVFSFRDLVVLRAAKELIDKGLATRKVKRSLAAVAHLLPDGRPLSTVRVSRAGDHVVVRQGELWWEVETGQGHMLFDEVRRAPQALAAPVQAHASDEWYDRAIDLEEIAPADAMRAYSKAIELDGKQADAHINLGRLLQQTGRLEEAEGHYRKALTCAPGNAVAAFNLGTLLEDQGHESEALQAYKAALPELADAHHNLARLYEKLGRRKAAIRHLRAFQVFLKGSEPFTGKGL